MNILTDILPTEINIDGRGYAVHSDFRSCLKIILAFEDNELTPQEKQIILLSNLYSKLPHDIKQAIEQAHLFLNGGKVSEEENQSVRLYSFERDASFIFAAFKQTHNVDLQKDDLHWWQFLALFMDLGSETTFCQLVSLRKRIKTGKATKEERQAALEMGEVFDVPEVDDRTLEEKEMAAEFERKVEEARRKRDEQKAKENQDQI